MTIELVEKTNDIINDELFFDVIDEETNEILGIMFTVGKHIAYEIKEQYRGNGIATQALKIITQRIDCPVLEIRNNNIASKRVAQKAGYVLVRTEYPFEIYEHESSIKRGM